jgi:hypothetical protein
MLNQFVRPILSTTVAVLVGVAGRAPAAPAPTTAPAKPTSAPAAPAAQPAASPAAQRVRVQVRHQDQRYGRHRRRFQGAGPGRTRCRSPDRERLHRG